MDAATTSGRRPLRYPCTPGGGASIRKRLGACALFALCAAAAAAPAASRDIEPTDAEFVEFLEYLGSWEGAEDEWMQFAAQTNETAAADAPQPDPRSTPAREVNASVP
jgi:hypothetical protein